MGKSEKIKNEGVSYISIHKQETPPVFPPTPWGVGSSKGSLSIPAPRAARRGLIALARCAPWPVHNSFLSHCQSCICPRHAHTKFISTEIVRSYYNLSENSELSSKNERNKNTILWRWPISRPFCPLDHPRQTEC